MRTGASAAGGIPRRANRAACHAATSRNRSGLLLQFSLFWLAASTVPTLPSADFSAAVRGGSPPFSHYPVQGRGTAAISRGKTRIFRCVNAGFTKCIPIADGGPHGGAPSLRYPLAPNVSRLTSGFCSSPRSFGFGFLQTSPRDDALAVSLAFGWSGHPSAYTWRSALHRHSYVPCRHTR